MFLPAEFYGGRDRKIWLRTGETIDIVFLTSVSEHFYDKSHHARSDIDPTLAIIDDRETDAAIESLMPGHGQKKNGSRYGGPPKDYDLNGCLPYLFEWARLVILAQDPIGFHDFEALGRTLLRLKHGVLIYTTPAGCAAWENALKEVTRPNQHLKRINLFRNGCVQCVPEKRGFGDFSDATISPEVAARWTHEGAEHHRVIRYLMKQTLGINSPDNIIRPGSPLW